MALTDPVGLAASRTRVLASVDLRASRHEIRVPFRQQRRTGIDLGGGLAVT